MGDINLSKQFYKPKPSYGIIYRYLLNKRYSIRGSVIRAKLYGNDLDFNSGFQTARYNETEATKFFHNIWDVTIQAEFNFLPYNTTLLKEKFTPYVSAGISGLIFPVHLDLPIAIPFGIGFKYNYNRRVGIGVEWTFHRTFDDDWDYNADPEGIDKQVALQYNKDWFSFVGFFLTYKCILELSCWNYLN